MVCGLVPAATDVLNVRQIIGDTDIFVPARDPDALANALLEPAFREE